MKDLLPYFERELTLIRSYAAAFAARFPGVAGRLRNSDSDPHVERLLQGVALLSARIAKRVDDGYPQFTEALLESLFPHYLRPFPSCTTVAFDVPHGELAAMAGVRTIARGTPMVAPPVQGTRCQFRTATDVAIAPLAIGAVRFEPLIQAPSATVLPPDATASISLTIAAVSDTLALPRIALDTLRIYADGDPSLCAALRDALFVHASGAFVEAADGAWLPLPAVPLAPGGCADDEALIPFGDRSHRAWRILTEYFCFPDKFRYVDVDLAALRALMPPDARSVTLHLALSRMRPESAASRLLRALQPANLRLFCTTAVNLFRHAAKPVSANHLSADYSVVANAPLPQAYEVYSVDHVRQARPDGAAVEYTQLYARGNKAAGRGHFWVLRHDEILADISPGYEKRLTLVDIDSQALEVESTTLSIDTTCTNRELPHLLGYGARGGDLALPDTERGPVVRMLGTPTLPYRFPGAQMHWRLISHLSLNHHALVPRGLPSLVELLTLHDLPRSPVTQRLLAGIVGLDQKPTTAWVRHERGSSLVHGIEVHITIDEEAFTGGGIYTFAQVMDEFLGLYVQLNSYVELVLLAQRDNKELVRCKRRSGNASLA